MADATALNDKAHFPAGPPHDLLDEIRASTAAAPAGQTPDDEVAMHAVCRYADIQAISKNPAVFSNYEKGIFPMKDLVAPLELNQNLLLYMDPPEHTKFRKILQTAFVPNSIAKREEMIRAIVDEQIDAVIEQGSCDFVNDIAVPIPNRTLGKLMGFPEEDLDQLAGWVHAIERAQQSPEPGAAGETFLEIAAYLHESIQRQKAEGASEGSITITLAEAEVEGESLTDEELLVFFALLIFAGNDTTRNTMGHGMRALIEHPEQMQMLRDDPSLIPNAVEEILRYASVVNYFCRTATEDTEVGGCPIKAGEKLQIWYAAGSRDPEANENPHEFDITRSEIKHMAFGGGGRHFCLGAGLARLELRVAFEQIISRLDQIEIAGEVTYLDSNWAHALTSLPLKFEAAA